jgi:hypothetical protein
MEKVPKNLSTPEEIEKHEKTTLKRNIALTLGRFYDAYMGQNYEKFSRSDELDGDTEVGSYLKEKLPELLKEKGVNAEDLIIEIEPGKPNTYGDGPEGGIGYYTTDVVIRSKKDNELLYATNLQDYGEGWSY